MTSDELVTEAWRLYSTPFLARSMNVDRLWSDDGETELARFPYSRVRFVKTYHATDWITYGIHRETGLLAEPVR